MGKKRTHTPEEVVARLCQVDVLAGQGKSSGNGPEFATVAVKDWISGVGATTAFIEPGSP